MRHLSWISVGATTALLVAIHIFSRPRTGLSVGEGDSSATRARISRKLSISFTIRTSRMGSLWGLLAPPRSILFTICEVDGLLRLWMTTRARARGGSLPQPYAVPALAGTGFQGRWMARSGELVSLCDYSLLVR